MNTILIREAMMTDASAVNQLTATLDKAEITGLVVSELARRKGLAKRLVQAAMDWANARSMKCLVVRSNILRDASHQFYPSVGFKLKKRLMFMRGYNVYKPRSD